MANCNVQLPEEFLLKLSRLGAKTDEIFPKVLEAGAEVVENRVRSNLKSVIGSGTKYPSRSTGQLVSSLGTSGTKQDKDGNFNVKIGVDQKRGDGKSNAMLASVLEFGKHGQPPKPFLKPAEKQSRSACIEAMISAFDREVGAV